MRKIRWSGINYILPFIPSSSRFSSWSSSSFLPIFSSHFLRDSLIQQEVCEEIEWKRSERQEEAGEKRGQKKWWGGAWCSEKKRSSDWRGDREMKSLHEITLRTKKRKRRLKPKSRVFVGVTRNHPKVLLLLLIVTHTTWSHPLITLGVNNLYFSQILLLFSSSWQLWNHYDDLDDDDNEKREKCLLSPINRLESKIIPSHLLFLFS